MKLKRVETFCNGSKEIYIYCIFFIKLCAFYKHMYQLVQNSSYS